MDREIFTKNVMQSLMVNFDIKDVNKIMNIMIVELGNYTVNRKTTEIAVRDNSSDNLIQLFCSTLLTEGKSKRTVREYGNLLRRFAKAVRKPLTEVNVFEIRAWLANMQNNVQLISCENYRSYLSSFYNWLHREELIEKNPMKKIVTIKYEQDVKMSFNELQIDAMRNSCKNNRERAEFELMLSSGARASEICAMNIEDIDFANRKVLIKNGKGNKQRITYMSPLCAMYLQKYLEERTDDMPYLFYTRNKTRLTTNSLERDVRRIGKDANVSNAHPHRFRRTFATELARKGMSIKSIQMLMGHSNVNVTMGYISFANDVVGDEYRRCA